MKNKEVNNNIKKCMKKVKENWIGEQCSETDENLRKNNSKRAYHLVKDLTTVKQGKATTCLAGEEEKLAKLVESLDKASTVYGMEISAEKTKLMTKQHQRHQYRDQSKWTET